MFAEVSDLAQSRDGSGLFIVDNSVDGWTGLEYLRQSRENIGDDKALGYTVRRVARDGTIADLAALVTALRDDLRR